MFFDSLVVYERNSHEGFQEVILLILAAVVGNIELKIIKPTIEVEFTV